MQDAVELPVLTEKDVTMRSEHVIKGLTKVLHVKIRGVFGQHRVMRSCRIDRSFARVLIECMLDVSDE